MKAFLATGIIGSFAFDPEGNIIEYRLFPKDPVKISERLKLVREGKVIDEERDIVESLVKKGYKEIVWDKPVQLKNISCVEKKDNLATKTLSANFRRFAIELKWVTTQAELNEIISKVNIELTKSKLKEKKTDKLIIHAVTTLDEIDKTLNLFVEKLREWYGLYFPEASKNIQSHEKFVEIVLLGKKENLKDPELMELIEKSSGMEFSDEDLEQLINVAGFVSNLYKVRKGLARYVEVSVKNFMPNTSAVAGPILAARLLALAGSLEKMSRMPSSTIQLLGAEKALFRHLKGGGKAPKYGILFSHPLVQKAPKKLKGKMARLVSAKISLAAKLDFFSKEDRSDELKKSLEEQAKKVLS
ncbi:MAG: hypothetical protein DRP15_03215 [Candidatus Aenigmatarchaeota archaeon]|nr:MAG: hypothetical protein DRP15_03215 [Candidatus Aenigmarchaeota archaeon]